MAIQEPTPAPKSMGQRMLSIPRWAIFAILFLCTAIPLFVPMQIPNEASESTQALFRELQALPDGGTVIIQSDWTNSTRGESRGQFDALLRILSRKNIKFGLMSVADPQAPEVARLAIDDLNRERAAKDLRPYKRWEDWVNLGYFPNAEGTGQQLGQSLRNTLQGRRDKDTNGADREVMTSPVFQGKDRIEQLDAFIVVTGTKSIIIAIERISQRVKMLGMVTGVMGPETLNYYTTGQLKGLSAGLKGVYDMEQQMETAYPGQRNIDRGARYYGSLHFAIFLLIIIVIIGNVGVVLTRGSGA